MALPTDAPLPDNYFMGGRNITPRGKGLVRYLQELTEYLSTTSTLSLYVNSVTGSDTYDGKYAAHTYGTRGPKATLQGVFNALPEIIAHNTVVHVSGTFADFGTCYLRKHVLDGVTLLIDGGTGYTVVDDNGGAHWTTIAGTDTTQLQVAPASWVADVHAGYIANILDGAAAGEDRMLPENTTAIAYPAKDFAHDPGIGATFDVVRPATTLSASTTASSLRIGCSGSGFVKVQGFTFSGTLMSILAYRNTTALHFSHIVHTGSTTYPIFLSDVSSVKYTGDRINTSTFVADTTTYAGVSMITAAKYCEMRNVGAVEIFGSYMTHCHLKRCGLISALAYGSRIKGQMAIQSCDRLGATTTFTNDAGYATTKIDSGAGVGLLVYGKSTTYIADIDVAGNGSHGIECQDSRIHFTGITTSSTNNTDGGLYAWMGSKITITNAAAPTMTGAGAQGDVTTDGTNNATTWAAVDGGAALADANQFVIVQEV